MKEIHDRRAASASDYGAPGNYVLVANISSFVRIAEAMEALGVI
jgi:glutamate dehydrogenase (NADP+)